MKFKLKNKKDVKNYIKNLAKRVDNVSTAFLIQANKNLLIHTPVRSGRLVSAYKIDFEEKQIKNNTPYLWYVNNGTIYQTGQHFIQISYEQAYKMLDQIVKQFKE